MALVLFVSAIIAGLIFKKSKLCTIYIFFIMYIFSAYRTFDADYNTYLIGYNNISSARTYRYAGYSSFVKIFSSMGLSFEDYNHVFFFGVFVLLILAIRLLTKNINTVLACYLLYSYSLDTVQMKSCIADVLALIGIALVFNLLAYDIKVPKKRIICSIISVLCLSLAIYMHFSTLYYVFALLIYFIARNRKNIGLRMLVVSGIILGLLYSGLLVIIIRYANVLRILGDLDYMGRWTMRSTRYGYLLYILIIGFMILSTNYNRYEMIKNERQKDLSHFLMTAVLVIPFVFLNGQYSRLLRVYMIITYTIFSDQSRSHVISEKRILNNLMCVAAISILFYLDIAANYENVLGALLKSNSFFGTMY